MSLSFLHVSLAPKSRQSLSLSQVSSVPYVSHKSRQSLSLAQVYPVAKSPTNLLFLVAKSDCVDVKIDLLLHYLKYYNIMHSSLFICMDQYSHWHNYYFLL